MWICQKHQWSNGRIHRCHDVTRVRFPADAGGPFEGEVSRMMRTHQAWGSFWRSRFFTKTKQAERRSGCPPHSLRPFFPNTSLAGHIGICLEQSLGRLGGASGATRLPMRGKARESARTLIFLCLIQQGRELYSIPLKIARERCQHPQCPLKIPGLLRELSPGPLAPEARIMPLDQAAKRYSMTCSEMPAYLAE